MSLGTGRNLSRRSYSGARRLFRVALHVAAVTTLAAVASVPVAQGGVLRMPGEQQRCLQLLICWLLRRGADHAEAQCASLSA